MRPMRSILRSPLSHVGLAVAALALAGCASGTTGGGTTRMESGGEVELGRADMGARSAVIAGYPAKQRETVTMMTDKYGQPDVVSEQMIAWFNKGPFVKTIIMRQEVAHNFPMPHVDYLTQTVRHRVPTDKFDDLAEYDGSVIVHRTRGEVTAQCDVEAMNFLALNLAHDVSMGRRTVEDARAFYAKTAMAFKQGDKSSPYVQGLTFQQESNAADPDRPAPGM